MMKEKIERILKSKLAAAYVEIQDDSDQHAGHKEAIKSGGGHFAVFVVSDRFKGKNRVERHRLVYEALEDSMDSIHALAVKAQTKEECGLRS